MQICLDQRTGAGCGAENRNSALHCGACGMPLRFALLLRDPGTQVGGYRIVQVIGHGGIGAVYEAEDLGRPAARVALKETFDPAGIRAFQAEFAVLHRLAHPNLPGYHQVFEHDGNGYLVMELVPGQSLQEVLDKHGGPLPESQVLGYALQLCDVLEFLHGQRPGIMHRDIKPANIRLTPEGRIKLVDFGLLKQGTQQTRQTIRGFGTPAYAPVEQYGRGSTDVRSDIYSLGATLYHLLTGQEPPPATERIALPADPLLPPRRANSRLSRHVADAVLAAMGLLQKDRPLTVAVMRQALLGVMPPPTMRRATPAPSASPARLLKTLQGMREGVRSLAYTPNGRFLAAASSRGVLVWYDIDKPPRTLDGHADLVLSVAWSPDAEFLASAGWDKTVRLWRVHGSPLRSFKGHTDRVPSVAWSPNGQFLASGGWDETVWLWHVSSNRMDCLQEAMSSRVNSVAWSPDGQFVATGNTDNRVRLWSVADCSLIQVLEGHGDSVTSVAWSPDGTKLASGSMDTTVRLWHAGDGHLLETLHGHTKGVTCVAWSPDGKRIASGGWDQKIWLWSQTQEFTTGELEGHDGCVWSVAWHPRHEMLASGSGDWTVRLWELNR
jgi:eukaryotic-like serine/threonine-protein kinase